MTWLFWLWAYICYALLTTFLFNVLHLQGDRLYSPLTSDLGVNLLKLVVNGIFLSTVVNWTSQQNASSLRKQLDIVLQISLLLSLLQLLVYGLKSGFGSTSSSSEAAAMYDTHLCFWGVPDKNIFGAKIAIFGFLYLINYFIVERRISLWRVTLVASCAFFSNSRTPLAALFIGIAYVLWRRFRAKGRVALIVSVLAIAPFALASLIRIDTILSTNDGMGIRIIYWTTFISQFSKLSILGSGFMSAEKFLTAYSPVYLGEPHLHNLFLNSYLDFGIVGVIAYTGFLVSFYKFCKKSEPVWFKWYWTAVFIPILAIMMTLSTGYESDTVVYLASCFIVGTSPIVSRGRLWPKISFLFRA